MPSLPGIRDSVASSPRCLCVSDAIPTAVFRQKFPPCSFVVFPFLPPASVFLFFFVQVNPLCSQLQVAGSRLKEMKFDDLHSVLRPRLLHANPLSRLFLFNLHRGGATASSVSRLITGRSREFPKNSIDARWSIIRGRFAVCERPPQRAALSL